MKEQWFIVRVRWKIGLKGNEAGDDDHDDDDDDDDHYDDYANDDDAKYKGVNERSLHSFHRQSNSPGREIPFDTRPSSCFAEYLIWKEYLSK